MLWKDAYNYRAVTLRHDITLDRVIPAIPQLMPAVAFGSVSGADASPSIAQSVLPKE